nr:fibroin heavy chain-like [Zonotrichia albicollis]
MVPGRALTACCFPRHCPPQQPDPRRLRARPPPQPIGCCARSNCPKFRPLARRLDGIGCLPLRRQLPSYSRSRSSARGSLALIPVGTGWGEESGGAGLGGARWAAIGGEGRFKKPRGPLPLAGGGCGRSDWAERGGAAAWFKNTKGAGLAAAPSALPLSAACPSRAGRGTSAALCPHPSLHGAGVWRAGTAGCKTGLKVGFGAQASPVSGDPPSGPARPGPSRRGVGAAVGPAAGSSAGSPAEGECAVCSDAWQRELLLPSPQLEGPGRAWGCL